MNATKTTIIVRKDERIILHADVDSFYAQVYEVETPALRGLPLAVQQKQIIVTCNYEARRRGLHKLQLISEAKKVCPDVIIILGEQLDKFRDASKALYKYLESFTWNKKVERLGFDEVFMDVTDIISYNQALLNFNDLGHSFFQLSRNDPTSGFSFDATGVIGHEYPEIPTQLPLPVMEQSDLRVRLILGSHLAHHIRHKLEEEKGYTATFGISTSKYLSKLIGGVHKPRSQTTLMPPYETIPAREDTRCMKDHLEMLDGSMASNVTMFVDSRDIGKIPGIGFKMSHKIRSHILSRPTQFEEGLVYGGTKELITVGDVRRFPGMGPELLEKLLGGPGSERGIGVKIWGLLNGIDDSEVKAIKKVPSQISIEDSYIRLDTIAQVYKELQMLSMSLLKRMRVDLLEDDNGSASVQSVDFGKVNLVTSATGKKWIAHPKTIRLTTRPRPLLNPDGTRSRRFNRISRSGPLPNFVFNLQEGLDALVEKLVQETLVPMFHRLHPEKQGWNLSLLNVGVTNMAETATEDSTSGGRDIGRMFKRQEAVLKVWKVEDKDIPPDVIADGELEAETGEGLLPGLQAEPSAGDDVLKSNPEDALHTKQTLCDEDTQWEEDEESDGRNRCQSCGVGIPTFAMAAHELYHALGD